MSQGPFITTAVLCDQVIEGKDGVLSAIRLVDTVTLTKFAAGQPIKLPADGQITPDFLTFNFLVTIKSGDFRGRGKVKLEPKLPSGRALPARTVDVELFGDEKGQHIIFRGGFVPTEEGIHWFDVYFEDRLLTRSPLAVRIVQSDSQTTTSSSAEESNQGKK